MRRIVAGLAALVVSLLGVAPAQSHTDACVFTGSFYSSYASGWTYNWQMWLWGPCAGAGLVPLYASGDIWTDPLSIVSGTGITSDGHRFAFNGKIVVLAVAGEVVGTISVLPSGTPNVGVVAATLTFVR